MQKEEAERQGTQKAIGTFGPETENH